MQKNHKTAAYISINTDWKTREEAGGVRYLKGR